MAKVKQKATLAGSLERIHKGRLDVIEKAVALLKTPPGDLAAVDIAVDALVSASSKARSYREVHATNWHPDGAPILKPETMEVPQ